MVDPTKCNGCETQLEIDFHKLRPVHDSLGHIKFYICEDCQEEAHDAIYRRYIYDQIDSREFRAEMAARYAKAVERHRNKKWWQFWVI